MFVFYVAFAALTALTGLGLLFAGWRRPLPARGYRRNRGYLGYPVPLGWSLIVLSGGFWVSATGPEFGISLTLFATGAGAWLFVLANRQQRARRDRGESSPPKPPTQPRTFARHAALFLLVVPVAAIAATSVSVALSLALPVSEVDAMVAVLVVMPVLWGCAAYWVVADSRTLRPTLTLVLGTLASATVIYL